MPLHWLVLGAALLVLLILWRLTRRHSAPSVPEAPLEGALTNHLASVARQQAGRGQAHVQARSGLQRELENALAFLCSLPGEELLPSARWLCDNARFLQEEAAGTLLARRELPPLPRSSAGRPLVCLFAQELVGHTCAGVNAAQLGGALDAWQEALPMTVRELDALPTVLRLTLLTRLCELSRVCAADQHAALAARRAHRLFEHNRRRRALRLCRRFADHPAFLEGLMSLDPENVWLLHTLESRGDTPDEIAHTQQLRQAENCLWIGNAITSLRALNRLDWDRFQEEHSSIHALLARDSVYARMDLESRIFFRATLGEIARSTHLPEKNVAAGLWTLSQGAKPDTLEAHCGYYLLDEGRRALLRHLRALRPAVRLRLFLHAHACGLLRLGTWTAFLGCCLGAGFSGLSRWMCIPFATVASYTLLQFALKWLRGHARPRFMPRMQLRRLTEENRTLVVCPTLLSDSRHALQMVKQLSILHEANPDEQLHFLLLGDFKDSLTATLPQDADIMATASAAVKALCEDTGHPFFYLQRERVFSTGENTYHSRERKRGGVDTVLRLIEGKPVRDTFAAASVDPGWFEGRYRYVITLDSDTQLPPGAALRLVGAMLHPLNRRMRHHHHMRGASVLQPRMETAAHTVTTPLGLLLNGEGGTDTYNLLAADPDQDVLERGTFMGKGIIDPAAFLAQTSEVIPDGLILSHDLLEGELTGCAFAGDIVLYDGQPQTLKGYLYRLHRWTRGDWQLLPCALPRLFPNFRAASVRRMLDGKARYKLWRNLFRSLIAPLRVLLALYGAMTGRLWLWAFALLAPELAWIGKPLSQVLKSMLCRLAILPCEAAMQVDAIARTLWRLLVSRRHLLAWTTAAQLSQSGSHPPMLFFSLTMSAAGLFAASVFFPGSAPVCGLTCALLWAGFAFALPFLEQERRPAQRPSGPTRDALLHLARETLLFFETAITDEDHALPPDNVQIDPNRGIAHRTSPTNIGLYLCALLAAEKLGLLETEALFERLSQTLTTLERLPAWHGLPYNWYDTRTLEPLSPAFISSVDSGNLAVCLLTCAQGVRALMCQRFAAYESLSARMDALVSAMRFDLLYDPEADLFRIGVDPIQQRPTDAHYDLLASESRLLSFAAIMLRQVPLRHWYRLGRPRARGQTLLSYSGTAFEYLMPLLFQPLTQGTLLELSCRGALRMQQAHRLGGAFGVSESGYHAFDPELNYQYKAFGLPSLALSPSVTDEVLAPYAAFLSLPMDLKSVMRCWMRMKVLGLEGPLGLFEAADFSPERTGRQSPRIVRSHMAHHQGMILIALCNALEEGYVASLFSTLPRALAYRLLLEEKPGRAKALVRHPLRRAASKNPPPQLMCRDAQPLTFPMDAHLLSGGDTTCLIDAQGGGFLRHRDLMLTRFHESCALPSGPRFYLRDSQSGAYWTVTDPHLTRSVRFETAQAVFLHTRFDVQCELRIWVHPLDGSVIHHLTLENRAGAERLMELCSYLEPALCPQRDDEAHPAFQNLFLQTERLGRLGVCVKRRQSGRRLWHLLVSKAEISLLRVQTDRMAFLGRGRSFHAPRALAYPIGAVADSLGDVIEPCLSLRGQFVLPAGGRLSFAFVTHFAHEGEKEEGFLERYASLPQTERTYDSALTRGVVCARFLRLSGERQAELSRLTGALAYAGQPMQNAAPASLPRRELWKNGISGDLPILLVECSLRPQRALLTLLLQAHAWHRMNGMRFDLVFLPDSTALRTTLEEGIAPGREGVYLLPAELGHSERALLRSAARLTLRADQPFLPQMEAIQVSVRAQPVYTSHPSSLWKPQLPPVPETLLSNGFGGFTPDGGDYQITLAPGVQTPAPWCHPLCNERFGTLASESGLVFTYTGNSQLGRLTRWPNDAVSSCGGEGFYLRDEGHRLLWSLTRQPLGHGMPVRVTYAPGEAVYESSAYGVYTKLTCFTDPDRTMGLRMTTLVNQSDEDRVLTLFHTCSFATSTCLSAEEGVLRGAAAELGGTVALCALDPAPSAALSLSDGAFQGLWSVAPFALGCLELPPDGSGTTGILAFQLRLAPGDSASFTTSVGFSASPQEIREEVLFLRRAGAGQRLHAVREQWADRLGRLTVDLPHPALNLLMNRWLPYQLHASRLWMRAGFYQAGGAIGFRDQLQDMLALLLTHPEEARSHLLLCAAHQFEEGDVQHWWHPPRFGVRTRVSDDRLFLPYVTAAYVEVTGDVSLLDETVPYLMGEALRADERERLFEAGVSEVTEPVLLHGLRAIDSVRMGPHGLPLMGSGDWNDGMNLVGGEHGESVWLGMFLCEVLRRFAPLCPQEAAQRLQHQRTQLLRALDRSAWDGAWYLRAWYSDGQKLGSGTCHECRMDLLPQAWGVLCGVSRDRCAIAMENAWRMLFEPDPGLVKLFTPPFDGVEEPGYLAGYVPGVRENGGQYTHAACWFVAALHQLGQDDRAWQLALRMLPTTHAATRQLAARYRVEPYVMAADIYANPHWRGRGGWTWYTGSAGWYWTIMLRYLLGLRKNGPQLRFTPVCPSDWDSIRITFRFGGTTYHLRAERSCQLPEADGNPLPDGVLLLQDDGRIHEALFPLR